MAFKENALYTPRPFEGMIVKVNLASQEVTNVTACLVAPNTVKFNSKQELFVVDRGKGEVVMINLTASDTDANRKVIAQFPANSIDNLAFDKVDRLFFSSTTDASLTEVFPNGELRIVCCGDISIPMILAAIKDTHKVYTVYPGALCENDLEDDANTNIITASAVTLGPLAESTSIDVWGKDLVFLSALSNTLMVWGLESETSKMEMSFSASGDVHPLNEDLIVSDRPWVVYFAFSQQ